MDVVAGGMQGSAELLRECANSPFHRWIFPGDQRDTQAFQIWISPKSNNLIVSQKFMRFGDRVAAPFEQGKRISSPHGKKIFLI